MSEMSYDQGQLNASDESTLPWFDEELFERLPRSRPVERPGERVHITGVPRLYLEDIEAIHYLLAKHSRTISMQTEEFRIKTPKALRLLPQERIMQFRFNSTEPHFKIDIDQFSHTIATRSDDPFVKELLEDIRDIFNRRRSRIQILRSGPWSIFVSISIMVASLYSVILFGSLPVPARIIIVILGLGAFFSFSTIGFMPQNRTGVVIPKYKKDIPPSWYVSDAIKIATVTAVLTAIVTAVATWVIVGD